MPNAAKFKIWSDGTRLNIAAEGQTAINALAGYEEDGARKYAEANDLTEFTVKNLIPGEKEKIKSRLSKSDYDNNIPFLAEEFENFKMKFGELKKVKVQGTTSFPWDTDTYRTNVLLEFERGSTDLYLGWNKGQLNDLTTETGRPFPLIMPLAAQSKTKFSAYDFLTAKLVAIRLLSIKSSTELSIKFQGQELKARKIQS